jgi:DEAD/DEAH box helicase domain-containing protein
VVIGQLERAAAPALLHPGAVYLHQGQSFLVERLDWDDGHAWVRPAEVDYYTIASGSQQVQVLAVDEQRSAGGVSLAYGPVQVKGQVSGFRQIKRHTHETLGYGEIQPAMPEQVLETDAFWLTLDEELLAPLRAAGQWRSDPNDYGPNWQQQRNAARARDGYRCTVCGAPEPAGRQHDVHHKQPFRSFGYAPGQNDAYRQANLVENLATLCRQCHQRVEQGQRLRTGLGGLAYALGSLAPLHLMCDPGDIGVVAEAKAPGSGLPTITIYEKAPAGIGFSQRLYELGPALLAAVGDLVRRCSCAAGCPACVGPVGENQQDDIDARQLTLALAAAGQQALQG